MCDYSLHNVKTRPAKVNDKLTTRQNHNFAPNPFLRCCSIRGGKRQRRQDLLPWYLTWLSSDIVRYGRHRVLSSRNPSFV